MSKTTSKAGSLLAAIQRAAPQQPKEAARPPKQVSTVPVITKDASKKAVSGKRGKPVQFWMHPEDQRLIRELAAWLAGQGERTSDSLVIRAALRTVRVGDGFVDAYRKASLLDGRVKRN